MALIPYPEALRRVEARLGRTDEVEVPIADCVGLVTTADIVSPDAVPPFDNTAVDGFAVRSADLVEVPAILEVVETIAAGSVPAVTLSEGTCARIMTGALIPPGADAVVMVEQTRSAEDDAVYIDTSAAPGAHIRPAGDDLAAGDLAIGRATRLRPAHVGLLATLGITHVRVARRPRVGVLSTGDELVGPDTPLSPGQIRDSNRQMLLALCDRIGVEAVDLGLIGDDESAIEAALTNAALRCDAVITSGGVSMGDYDYVKAVLGRIAEMEWMQVAIKPAKPFAFGTIGDTPVFGLPGNPVSSLVSFELFAHPGLRVMMGDPDPHTPQLTARTGNDMRRRSDGKTHYVRVTLATGADGVLEARSTGAQGSHQLAASAGADALAVLPDGEGLPSGSQVSVVPIG